MTNKNNQHLLCAQAHVVGCVFLFLLNVSFSSQFLQLPIVGPKTDIFKLGSSAQIVYTVAVDWWGV